MKAVGMIVAVVFLASCASSEKINWNDVAARYYGQTRTYDVLSMSGVKEVHLVGDGIRLEVKAEMGPLSILPKDQGIATALIGATERTLLTGAGILTAGSVMKKLSTTHTVKPEIVRPEVVQPTVIYQ